MFIRVCWDSLTELSLVYNPEVHNDHCKYGHTDGPKVRSVSQSAENKESTVTDSTATPAVTTFLWTILPFPASKNKPQLLFNYIISVLCFFVWQTEITVLSTCLS